MSKKSNTTTENTVTFEIVKNIAVLRTSPAGWTRELNIVKWGDREPAFDVRDWNPDHTKMGKGLAFSEEELRTLCTAFITHIENETKAKKSTKKGSKAAK